MKIIFSKSFVPKKKNPNVKNELGNPDLPNIRDEFTHGVHDLYTFMVHKNGLLIKDCHGRVKFHSDTPFKGVERLENPERTYEFEYSHRYDWLTEYDNLQKLLSNPYKVSGRYKILEYDEVKRKGFLILSKQMRWVPGNLRAFKGQRVMYLLYHKRRAFPRGAMICPQKPSDVIIRFDTFKNNIRLEGPNSHPKWQNFTI